METRSDCELGLVKLSDGRPGVRTGLTVEIREPAACPAGDSQLSTSGETSTLNSQPVLDFVASTDTLDRYQEVIDPAGWRLEGYRRNPVFQNAHKYGDIIFTLGRALVTEVRDLAGRRALFQRVQFAVEANPMARIAYALYKGQFLRAVSVGFIPVRWENGTPESDFRRKYLEQELLEVSAVGIPANPDALALGLKAGAVERSDVRELVEVLRESAGMGPSLRDGSVEVLNLARELHRLLRCG